MFFQHIYEPGLAQASYLVGCQATGEALVIDPRRDIQVYLDAARKEGLAIKWVTETHIHADFVSGARELSAATGAGLLLSDEGGEDWRYRFPHRGLCDGDVFWVGRLKVQALHTPGHTPEHISFVLTDTPAGNHPVMVFTGDFVFVGDVGRPDLLEEAAGLVGTKLTGARQMFASLQRFRQLPDYVQVWPGHGAGSACGKALGAVPSSTVGYERLVNWALQFEDEAAFVTELLSGQPEPPRYFAMMKRINREGPALLQYPPTPRTLPLAELQQLLSAGMVLVDTRDKDAFASGHIPGSLNILDDDSFTTWAGWMLSYDRSFALVAGETRIGDLATALARIGFDAMAGYIPDLAAWIGANLPLAAVSQIAAAELYPRLQRDEVTLLDVRNRSEFEAYHIPGAIHIQTGQLPDHLAAIPRHRPVVVYCLGGDRSSLAASYLQGQGFTNLFNLTGGIRRWRTDGFPVTE